MNKSNNFLSYTLRLAALLSLLLLTACGSDSNSTEQESAQSSAVSPEPSEPILVPLPGFENSVPELTQSTTVIMRTGTGEITIEVFPQAAPNAVVRFLELVEAGFYDDTPVFRVVPDFVAQFGINWRAPFSAWQDNNFDDDPTLFSLERGTLAFAKAGPDTNSTQVFINHIENNRLAAPQFNFAVFGKVVSGMEVVDAFIPVGDPGGGLDQERLWGDGGAYLESLSTKPVMIEEVSIVTDDSP